jgi:diguanylate cyclase (GGDEF)-like protein/PAS domain S-box-containing protein
MTASFEGTAGSYSPGELRTALALHAIAVSGMAQGICVLDEDHRIVLFNQHFVEIIGVPRARVFLGASIRDLFGLSKNAAKNSNIASREMWREIEEMLACGDPFRLQRKIPNNGTIVFQFQPTAGGGWVATCEKPSEPAIRKEPKQIEVLHQAIEHASDGLCVFDADQRLVICNEQYLRIYGFDRSCIKPGVDFQNIVEYATKRGIFSNAKPDVIKRDLGALFRHETATLRCPLSDGRVIEIRVLPIESGGWLTEHEDVTRQLRYKQALQDRNDLLDAALDHMAHGLCAYDAQLRLIVVNRRYLEIYGLKREDAPPGTPMIELMRRSIERGIHSPGVSAEQMFADLTERLIENREPVIVRHLADGRIIAVRHQPMSGGGWVGTYEDITERYRAEENIAHMARHDALTGLPNRLLFSERMSEGLARVADRNEAMLVMCFDLDNFKAINDSLGHPFGDKLLRKMAERLREVIGERGTFARLGGDEFAIVHPTGNKQEAERLARQLINATSRPFVIDGQEINSSICIGIAIAPENGTTGDQLMKCADLALYRAKAQGRNSLRFFDPEMDLQLQARRALEVDLRRALSAGEFHLEYQPQINLALNKIVGMEALLRWTHPERGQISPSEFIPVAEETGLIVPLGEWVLRQACAEAARWPTDIRLAVNLSPVQFRNRAMVSTITHALAAARLPAERLELEITEAMLMQKDEASVGMLHQLRSLGVRIAMDDFGTGYSSLSYLRSFPFDKIKIDQIFIADVDSNDDSATIVKTIAALGAAMGIETTAEGIETAKQLELVRHAGCTEGQGFLIGRPSTAAEARKLLRNFQRKTAAA